MKFETFMEFAVKTTCIFCGAEKSVGVEEHCGEDGTVATEQAKSEAVDTFKAAGWQVIIVPSVPGVPDVVGMACPNCKAKGVIWR